MRNHTRSADTLVDLIVNDPARLQALKRDPLLELEKLRDEADEKTPRLVPEDPWMYRIVVIALGVVVLAAVVGAIVLAASKLEVPQALIALGSTALGALAGLLAPSPISKP